MVRLSIIHNARTRFVSNYYLFISYMCTLFLSETVADKKIEIYPSKLLKHDTNTTTTSSDIPNKLKWCSIYRAADFWHANQFTHSLESSQIAFELKKWRFAIEGPIFRLKLGTKSQKWPWPMMITIKSDLSIFYKNIMSYPDCPREWCSCLACDVLDTFISSVCHLYMRVNDIPTNSSVIVCHC